MRYPAPGEMVDRTWPVRPDSPYAIGKIFGENLGQYYADKYGISTLVIRLGAVNDSDKPDSRRQYPGYLSQADCMQMIDRCLSAPDDMMFEIFDAISENKIPLAIDRSLQISSGLAADRLRRELSVVGMKLPAIVLRFSTENERTTKYTKHTK